MMQDILVLGGGSAGLMAALSFKRHSPETNVRIVRSPEIGVIGVGEATTPNLPYHLFDFLGLSPRRFYAMAEPTWKMGIHFIWGPRGSFEYAFEPQLDVRAAGLPRPSGYYCDDDFSYMCLQSALMSERKAFAMQPGGGPEIPSWHAFHLDNPRLVRTLETFAREFGIEIIDAKVETATRGPQGVSAIILEDGRQLTADFYIDASGFRSQLLGQTLNEPYISYSNSLFNDRAMVGSWQRAADEEILPYTTAETMNSGWCWRIDHETEINRGYVYSSNAISDDDARAELQAKNPKLNIRDRIVKFRSGRYQRGWVDNVWAIGNSCGFVEPLESSALMVVCWQCQTIVDLLKHIGDTLSVRELYNKCWADTWDELRDFLSLHFRYNTLLDTPYWRHCNNDADISTVKPLLDFYEENGPTGFCRYKLGNTGSQFGVEGFLVMLVGNKIPYRNRHQPTEAEWQIMNRRRVAFKERAQQSLSVAEALAYIRHPNWRWNNEPA